MRLTITLLRENYLEPNQASVIIAQILKIIGTHLAIIPKRSIDQIAQLMHVAVSLLLNMVDCYVWE